MHSALCALAGRRWRSQQDDAEAARKGVELAKKKNYDGAAEEFSKAIKANPKAARHYSNRGKAYRAAGKLAEAEADFSKVIEMEPKNANAFSERGKGARLAEEIRRRRSRT